MLSLHGYNKVKAQTLLNKPIYPILFMIVMKFSWSNFCLSIYSSKANKTYQCYIDLLDNVTKNLLYKRKVIEISNRIQEK